MMKDMTADLERLKTEIETTPFLVDLSTTSPYTGDIMKCYRRVRQHLNSALEASQEIDGWLKRLGRRPNIDTEA